MPQLFSTSLGPWKVFPQRVCSVSALLGDRQGWSWAAHTNLPTHTAVSSFLVGKLSRLMSIAHLVKLRYLWNCCLQVTCLCRIPLRQVSPWHPKAYFNFLANFMQFIYLFSYFFMLYLQLWITEFHTDFFQNIFLSGLKWIWSGYCKKISS